MGTTRTYRSALVVAAVCVALISTALVGSASAGPSMTFAGMVGKPRLDAPESVAVDSSGNVYVAEPGPVGTTTIDQIAKYSADGVFMDVIAGPGTGSGQVYDPTSVAVAPNDDLYVLDQGNDRVTRFDALGNYLGQWGANGTGNGQFKNAQGIAVDSVGNVYVADTGNHRVQAFTSSGGWVTAWPVAPLNGGPLEIAVDGADVLYVVGGNTVWRYDTSGAPTASSPSWSSGAAIGITVDASSTVSVAFTSGVRQYDATGALLGTVVSSGTGDGQLTSPQGIVSAPSGQIYVADTGNGRIQRFSSAGTYQTTWGAYPSPGVMDVPTGLAVDVDGNAYVTNKAEAIIQKFASDGSFITSWGGPGNFNGQLSNPTAIAVSSDGYVYVADTGNQRIQKFDTDGNYVAQWGSFGTGDGQMSSPQGVAVDASGHVFVADTSNNRIQRFSTTGTFQAVWGGTAFGTGDGQFHFPRGIAIDGGGNVWVADSSNNRLQEFTSAGAFVAKVAGPGSSALDGKFSAPTDLEFDAFGTMYVLDKNNDRVQRLSSNGTFISKFGSTGLDLGQFTSPGGLAIDASGRVLVADTSNNRVETFIDANGPDTQILTGPPSVSSSTSASFTFQTLEPGSTFECRMDSGAYASCVSGQSYAGLAEAPHTFYVRASDNLANLGDPATYSWTIDVTPPDVNINSTPPLITASPSAAFTFSTTDLGSTFKCAVDGATAVTCTSPYAPTVSDGGHTFSVFAIDAAGNIGQPATYGWTVDTTPPSVSITKSPPAITTANAASFTFTSGDPSATFECHIDGLTYAACTSPADFAGLTGGLHIFYVRASDTLGNVSAPATKQWTVDAASHRPDAQIATGTTYVGNGVYNSTGTSQTQTQKTAVGTTVSFKLRIENDGSDTDQYTLLGIGSGNGYTVTYFAGSTDITSKVVAGTYTFSIASAAAKAYTLKVKVGKSATASRSITIRATSGHDPSALDVVKAVVKKS